MRIGRRIDTSELGRMLHWAAIAAALYWLAFGFGLQDTQPGMQGAIFHYANLTARGFIGYWLARGVLGRVDYLNVPTLLPEAVVYAAQLVSRAIIVAAAVWTAT